jgi:hypothetical protein
MVEKYWQPGEVIVHRYVGHGDGLLWGWTEAVIEDGPERTVLYKPHGTPSGFWQMDDKHFLPERPAQLDALHFLYPRRPYYISLFFDAGLPLSASFVRLFGEEHGRFLGWKVDMAAPHRRTALGFDTTDDVLDIIMRSDGSWYVKDDADLDKYTEMGVYTPAEATRIRAACEEAMLLVEARLSPFDAEWIDWSPPHEVPDMRLPKGWNELAGGDVHLSTLNFEAGLPGRPYDAWRQ